MHLHLHYTPLAIDFLHLLYFNTLTVHACILLNILSHLEISDLKESADEVHLGEFMNEMFSDVKCQRPHQQHMLLSVDYCPTHRSTP